MNPNSGNNESDEGKPWRVAVVGAGITGLAAAHRLIELAGETGLALDLTVFEASDRVGGVIETRTIGDFLVETGPDSFITNKPWALDLCQRLGLDEQLIPTNETFRRSLVLRRGKPVAVPEGFMLLAPAKIWPVLKSPIFSPFGKLRLAMEYFVPRRTETNDESLASFVRRRFGREVLDRIVQPMIGGIYTSDPEKLSLKATMPRFLAMEAEYRSLIRATKREAAKTEKQSSGARYGLFLTLASGLSNLTETLESRITKSAKIQLNSKVTKVCQTEEGFDVTVENDKQSSRHFDGLIIALPAYRAADLLLNVNRQLADDLNSIEFASSAIVVTGHKLKDVRHPLDAFGLVVPAIENRQILAVSFPSRKFEGRAPDDSIQMRTFIGGAMQPELFDKSDDELAQITKNELTEIFGVTAPPEFASVCKHKKAMPQFHLGHVDRVERIQQQVSTINGLSFAGNALHGVGIPDCIHSGESAAEDLYKSRNLTGDSTSEQHDEKQY